MWRQTGDPHLDALLADPRLRYFVAREIRYGQTRVLEVGLTAIMLGVGIVLLWPIPTFTSPSFRVISLYVGEPVAGSIALLTGLMRAAALIRNGGGAYTPIPRAIGCLGGCMFWSAISLGLAFAIPPLSTGLAVYPVLALAELYSARRAGADAFVLDSFGRRRARSKKGSGGDGA